MTQVDSELRESQGSALDPTASLLAGRGRPQHPGRVSGLGLGPTPTRLPRSSGAGPSYTAGSSHASAKRPGSSSSEELREELRQEFEARIVERDRQFQERDRQLQTQLDQLLAAATALRHVVVSIAPNISVPDIPDLHMPPVPPLPRHPPVQSQQVERPAHRQPEDSAEDDPDDAASAPHP